MVSPREHVSHLMGLPKPDLCLVDSHAQDVSDSIQQWLKDYKIDTFSVHKW